MQNKSSKKRLIQYITLSAVGLIVMAGISILAFNILAPKQVGKKTTVTMTTVVPLPPDLLKAYTDSTYTTIKEAGYTKLTSQYISPTVLYTPKDSPYAIRMNPQNFLAFGRDDKSIAKNDTPTLQLLSSFLVSKGLVQADQTHITGASSTVFDSVNVVCQVNEYVGSSTIAASFNIGCITHQVISTEITSIDTLLATYKASHTLPKITDIQRTYTADGTKKLTKLYVNAKNQTPSSFTLYFATLDQTWNYIGLKVTPSIDSTKNQGLSDELKTAIANKKYGDFLSKNIQ